MVLIEKSIQVILEAQAKNGAYPASPDYPTYQYCWLRDGSFIAHAMDVSGEYASAAAFFEWVDRAITGCCSRIRRLIQKYDEGSSIEPHECPPARYTMDGTIEESDWPKFQMDGYGAWLWALCAHIQYTGDTALVDRYHDSISLSVEYLKRFWDHENYDCWEENGDKVHASTLGCIYGGLNAINEYLRDNNITNLIETIRLFISSVCIHSGRLCKYVGSDQVDASLLWLCVPFRVFSPESSVMKETVKEIEKKLLCQGGVYRYVADTYYGGGEWLLLSCWLGWYYCAIDDVNTARRLFEWVGSQADNEGLMPEQVLDHVHEPTKIKEWVDRWGEVAKPLLWSHAMYIILDKSLRDCRGSKG